MSAQTVTKKIEEKAQAAAEAIIAEAREKAASDRRVILEEATERADKLLEAAKQNAAIAEKGRAQADEMNIKLGILGVKRELLASAKAQAKAKLAKMDEAEFVKVFSKYLAESELSGEFVIIPSASHRSLCKNTLTQLEKAANIKLTLSDSDAEFDTGFMLSAENYDVEFSLDAVLDEVFEKNEKAIANILFETGDVK